MSKITDQYDSYLDQHISNVQNAYNWIKDNLTEILDKVEDKVALDKQIKNHDHSKWSDEEYEPYANYFFGTRSDKVKDDFKLAWQHHWLNNEHHPEHWVQAEKKGLNTSEPLEMPYNDIIEMLCDHWSFSWKTKNLKEIFDWYKINKNNLDLNEITRKQYEDLLKKLEKAIDQYETDNS